MESSLADYNGGHNLTVYHNTAELLDDNERVAFTLKNRTGERVRIHTHTALETDISSSQTTIAYLHHMQTTG